MANISKTFQFGLIRVKVQEYPDNVAHVSLHHPQLPDFAPSIVMAPEELDVFIKTLCKIQTGKNVGMYEFS